MSSILIFYGFSGDQGRPVPSFPDGTDHDRSFQIVAETLKVSLEKLFPADDIRVQQAWTKDQILPLLESPPERIRQVHIACHGLASRLSLAYYYDHLTRLRALARHYNVAPGTEDDRAIAAMRDEDALLAGFFSRALDPARVATIRGNHESGASWQIWGCFAGQSLVRFEYTGDPDLTPYFDRFNFGLGNVPGIAVDIATSLDVTCTAARDGSGLSFWHGPRARRVKKNNTSVNAVPPFWLWSTRGSRWVSYDSAGSVLPNPVIFGLPRGSGDLPTPKPPRWLTDLFWA